VIQDAFFPWSHEDAPSLTAAIALRVSTGACIREKTVAICATGVGDGRRNECVYEAMICEYCRESMGMAAIVEWDHCGTM
jgi:hypothetical protein